MGLVWFLASFLVLATASSFATRQEYEQGLNQSALHFTLYHVQGHGSPLTSQPPPSFSELVAQDQARVKHLNSRFSQSKTSSVTNSASHKSEYHFGQEFISTPVNPAMYVANYYVKIGLGTPTTSYPVLIDTGSSFSWLQCKPCEGYCHQQDGPIFDPSASSTNKRLSCTTPECNSLKEATLNDPNCTSSNECVYTASYGDKSVSKGYLSQDSLTLTQSETLPGFVYGCGQDNRGLFGVSAGLFGLNRNKLSMFSQLSPKYGNAFSYCLPTRSGGSGGSLSIGSDSLMGSPYKFTPMLTYGDTGLYFLSLSAIVVAGKTLGVTEAEYKVPTIIDSGSTITTLPASVYAALRDEFTKIMSTKHETAPGVEGLDTCYKGSLKEIMSDVPQVRMVFQGEAEADLTLPPQNVLFDENGITCLAFAAKGTEGFAIIGNHQHQTYSVAYDVINSRIGFATGGCSRDGGSIQSGGAHAPPQLLPNYNFVCRNV